MKMQTFKAYVIGKRLQTETAVAALSKNEATFRFAAAHNLKTYEVALKRVSVCPVCEDSACKTKSAACGK